MRLPAWHRYARYNLECWNNWIIAWSWEEAWTRMEGLVTLPVHPAHRNYVFKCRFSGAKRGKPCIGDSTSEANPLSFPRDIPLHCGGWRIEHVFVNIAALHEQFSEATRTKAGFSTCWHAWSVGWYCRQTVSVGIPRSWDEQQFISGFQEFSDSCFFIPVRLHELGLESHSPETRSRMWVTKLRARRGSRIRRFGKLKQRDVSLNICI